MEDAWVRDEGVELAMAAAILLLALITLAYAYSQNQKIGFLNALEECDVLSNPQYVEEEVTSHPDAGRDDLVWHDVRSLDDLKRVVEQKLWSLDLLLWNQDPQSGASSLHQSSGLDHSSHMNAYWGLISDSGKGAEQLILNFWKSLTAKSGSSASLDRNEMFYRYRQHLVGQDDIELIDIDQDANDRETIRWTIWLWQQFEREVIKPLRDAHGSEWEGDFPTLAV